MAERGDGRRPPAGRSALATGTGHTETRHMATGARRTRVLVVDDDPGVTGVLRIALRHAGYDVETSPEGHDALRKARHWRPELVVLDVLMPGMDGLEVCRRIRASDPETGILLLTAKDGVADQIVGLDAGADDYLVKPFTRDVLLARLRALTRRRDPAPGEVLTFADLSLDTAAHVARRGAREIHLTATEYRLLAEFLRHPEQVLSKEHLTERVWRYDFEGNYNVVEVYIRYLRQKLEQSGEARVLHTLRGSGYILRHAAP